MTTLASAISKAISTNLLNNLPSSLAGEFNLDPDMVRQHLSTFLSGQLPTKVGKSSTRAPSQKGTNGKGRTSGYILFSSANRDSVIDQSSGEQFYKQRKTTEKDESGHFVYEDVMENGERVSVNKIPFTEVGRRLGRMWNALSDSEREEWNRKADSVNTRNGLTPTPAPTPTPATNTKTTRKEPAVAANSQQEMRVSRDPDSKAWLVNGTNFVVASSKNKQVVGKLNNKGKIVTLSTADRKTCDTNGWSVREAPAKKASAEESGDEDS